MTTPYVGEVQMFGFDFAPRGWAFCNGELLPISQNTALFSLIGTSYGGNGQTTFQLPNLSQHVPCGQGRGPGLTPRTLGQSFGAATVALNANQIPSHTHSLNLYIDTNPATRGSAPASGNALTFPLATQAFATGATADVPFADNSIGPAGNGQAHENEQPYLALNFSIALVGNYPSFP